MQIFSKDKSLKKQCSAVQKIMWIQVQIFSYCSHQTSEGGRCDLSDLYCDMVAGARASGLSISETPGQLFSLTKRFTVYTECKTTTTTTIMTKKKKNIQCAAFLLVKMSW